MRSNLGNKYVCFCVAKLDLLVFYTEQNCSKVHHKLHKLLFILQNINFLAEHTRDHLIKINVLKEIMYSHINISLHSMSEMQIVYIMNQLFMKKGVKQNL